MRTLPKQIAAFLILAASMRAAKDDHLATVTILRVPQAGIQPQIAVDHKGVIHMVYFAGDPAHGDLYYVRSTNQTSFSAPLKVNSHPGSAMATGNIRGAHIALGKDGRVHVAWNGTYEVDRPSTVTEAFMKHPMVYTRLNDAGTAFEPERNVIQSAYGLDGGGAIAADPSGNVYVVWHAPTPGTKGEENRRIWIAHSTNDGATFEHEKPAWENPTGACGCCGMGALADSRGNLFVLFRSAKEVVHRDMYLLTSSDHGKSFQGSNISPWNIGACVMSMEHLAESPSGILAAWETMGNVFYGLVNPSTMKMSTPVPAPGDAKGRKYPAVAGNARGETLLAWTESMGWKRGGSIAWQLFDSSGKPQGATGHAEGVPAWSLIAAFARPDGQFTVVY